MLIYADGFDHYGTGATGRGNMLAGAWSSISSDIFDVSAPISTHKRTGSYSMRVTSSARLSTRGVRPVLGVGFGLLLEELPGLDRAYVDGISFYNQVGAGIINFAIMPDGAVKAQKGGPSSSEDTILAVSDSVVTAGTFGYFEVKVIVDDVVGAFEVRYNERVILHVTNLNLGANGIANVQWQNVVLGNGGPYLFIDDMVMWDDNGDYNNDFMGPVRVLTTFPVGDGSPQDWTPVGETTAYETVDDIVPDGDATYIGTDTLGDVASLALSELPPEITEISAIFIPIMGRIDDAGTGAIQASMDSSGDEVTGGSSVNMTTVYSYWPFIFEYDPHTNGPWTPATFEAALLKIEKTA